VFHYLKNTPNHELDKYFERNASETQKYVIELGAYFFSYAQTLNSIEGEAEMLVNKYPGVFGNDVSDNVSSWRFENRPEEGESYIVRCVVTNSNLTTYEDMICVSFEPLKKAETRCAELLYNYNATNRKVKNALMAKNYLGCFFSLYHKKH